MIEKKCNPSRELRIRRMGASLSTNIKHNAACVGIPANKFVKPFLQTILEEFPDYMRIDVPDMPAIPQTPIRGVGKTVKQQLEQLATYIGVDRGDLIKVLLAIQMARQPKRNIITD